MVYFFLLNIFVKKVLLLLLFFFDEAFDARVSVMFFCLYGIACTLLRFLVR